MAHNAPSPTPPPDNHPLATLRQAIDDINHNILTLLTQRGTYVQAIAQLAQQGHAPTGQDRDREADMLKQLCDDNPGPYSHEDIRAIFSVIFERSLRLKREARP